MQVSRLYLASAWLADCHSTIVTILIMLSFTIPIFSQASAPARHTIKGPAPTEVTTQGMGESSATPACSAGKPWPDATEFDCRRKAELRAEGWPAPKNEGPPPVSWAPGDKLAAHVEVRSIEATPSGNASICNYKSDFRDYGNTVDNDSVGNTQCSDNDADAVSQCHLNVSCRHARPRHDGDTHTYDPQG